MIRQVILFAHLCLAFMLISALVTKASAQENGTGAVLVLTMEGAVGPAFDDYLEKSLRKARDIKAQLVLIELNTPGGLLTTTRSMTSRIIESDIPIAIYVTPASAHAASAGTFLLYSAHIAAMTRGTNIGAASPIQMGGGTSEPDQGTENSGEGAQSETTAERKAMNDTRAYMRSLSEFHGRNADWADLAVKDAVSLTAQEALDKNVITYIADDRSQLLSQISGTQITLKSGKTVTVTLPRNESNVVEYPPDLRIRFLTFITDPNIAMILMMIGVYGIIFEMKAPGSFVPGTVGGLSLLAGLYAMDILSADLTGLLLLCLGFALILAEVFVPSFGILGLGGTAAMVFGAFMLFDPDTNLGLELSQSVLIGIGLFGVMLVAIIVYMARLTQKIGNQTGLESLIGETGIVTFWDNESGKIRIQGELWQARSDTRLSKGDKAQIVKVDGLVLRVRPVDKDA